MYEEFIIVIKITKGFTLIELMIVIVVISILASIAFASYNSSLVKARRLDAARIMTEAAQYMERNYTDHNQYTKSNFSTLYGSAASPHYELLIEIGIIPSSTDSGANQYFKITAQSSSDKECSPMTLDSRGIKTAKGQSSGDIINKCW